MGIDLTPGIDRLLIMVSIVLLTSIAIDSLLITSVFTKIAFPSAYLLVRFCI